MLQPQATSGCSTARPRLLRLRASAAAAAARGPTLLANSSLCQSLLGATSKEGRQRIGKAAALCCSRSSSSSSAVVIKPSIVIVSRSGGGSGSSSRSAGGGCSRSSRRCWVLQGPMQQRCPLAGDGLYGGGRVVVAAASRRVVVMCRASSSSASSASSGASDTTAQGLAAFAGVSQLRRVGKGVRRSPKSDSAAPGPSTAAGGASGGGAGGGTSLTSGPAPSAASSPVPAPGPGGSGVAATAGGVAAAASSSSSTGGAAVAVVTRPSLDGSDSDYESPSGSSLSVGVGGNVVPFARRQPRALVLDCAYRPINVLTWYKAFHFDYFGKGEVLEYYPPPAVCTTGSGDHPLPAVLRVPQYTADMQDLCSRVACTRRNIMVRDGFCCQYCGSRRDLSLDHVHPASKGGKDTWENLVTACMRCNQKKSDRTLRELGWKLRRQPKEPTSYEIGIVAGISTSDILRPPPEWESYIAPYRERLEGYRRAAVEAGLINLMESD